MKLGREHLVVVWSSGVIAALSKVDLLIHETC